MEQWFQDAKLLTDRALEALYLAMGLKKPEEVKVKISKQEAQELVLVFFNIKPGDDTTDVQCSFPHTTISRKPWSFY